MSPASEARSRSSSTMIAFGVAERGRAAARWSAQLGSPLDRDRSSASSAGAPCTSREACDDLVQGPTATNHPACERRLHAVRTRPAAVVLSAACACRLLRPLRPPQLRTLRSVRRLFRSTPKSPKSRAIRHRASAPRRDVDSGITHSGASPVVARRRSRCGSGRSCRRAGLRRVSVLAQQRSRTSPWRCFSRPGRRSSPAPLGETSDHGRASPVLRVVPAPRTSCSLPAAGSTTALVLERPEQPAGVGVRIRPEPLRHGSTRAAPGARRATSRSRAPTHCCPASMLRTPARSGMRTDISRPRRIADSSEASTRTRRGVDIRLRHRAARRSTSRRRPSPRRRDVSPTPEDPPCSSATRELPSSRRLRRGVRDSDQGRARPGAAARR